MIDRNKFSAAFIARINNAEFHIPVYQRLYEWDKAQIETLLSDLYESFSCGDGDYHIGVMTAAQNNTSYTIIDGQQRFVTLTLFGIIMRNYCEGWSYFLEENGKPRLHFDARCDDEAHLTELISSSSERNPENVLDQSLDIIEKWLELNVSDKEGFAEYVLMHTVFFISIMPESYGAIELNRYFEAMNSMGRDLEQHEVLKVELLKKVDEPERFTAIWNNAYNYFEGTDITDDVSYKPVTIREIKAFENEENKKNPTKVSEFGTIMNFSLFLLNVLYVFLRDEQKDTVVADKFFDVRNLSKSFAQYLSPEDYSKFFELLEECTDIFKENIVTISNNESEEYQLESGQDEYGCLRQYLAMLAVSSSDKTYYRWLAPYLSFLRQSPTASAEEKLSSLKKIDNELHGNKVPNSSDLCYGKIDRYWFWRLDYYIWERRNELFAQGGLFESFTNLRNMVDNYKFSSSRSIEHVAPQHPDGVNALSNVDEFGNLVMISSSFNSRLSNTDYAVKRGYVEAHIKDGLVESLSMILLYKDHSKNEWTEADIAYRTRMMMDILTSSF